MRAVSQPADGTKIGSPVNSGNWCCQLSPSAWPAIFHLRLGKKTQRESAVLELLLQLRSVVALMPMMNGEGGAQVEKKLGQIIEELSRKMLRNMRRKRRRV